MLALLMPGNVVPGAELVNQSTVLPGFAACQPSPAWFEQETSARAEIANASLECRQHSDEIRTGKGPRACNGGCTFVLARSGPSDSRLGG